jgi:hypothetical protein
MHRKSRYAVAALLLVVQFISLPAAVSAWNNTGHMVVAYTAYQNLTPDAKERIKKILRQHPEYSTWVMGVEKQWKDRDRSVFLIASTFPDMLKGDPRFYDERTPPAEPPKPIPGYPDMQRHGDWHFILTPYFDGVPVQNGYTVPEPNVVTKIEDITKILERAEVSEPQQAYYLSWLIHLVGDVHQPLHTVTRFSEAGAKDDAGGNLFLINDEAGNLHRYWDDLLGSSVDSNFISTFAEQIMSENKAEPTDSSSAVDWKDESVRSAQDFVYSIKQPEMGYGAPAIPTEYKTQATSIAHRRVAQAGYRLARVLNGIYGKGSRQNSIRQQQH